LEVFKEAAMQLISEKIGQEIGSVPHRIDQTQEPSSLGIDFVEVAESHVLFFSRVKDYVMGDEPHPQEDLSELRQSCSLERWLKGVGALRFGHLSSFGRLHHAHAEFHRHATEILATVHAGSWTAAEHMRKKELSQALRRVLITLTELNESINKQAFSVN
jgi:hypothetical protein